jgi:hypothetical protein
VLLDGPHKRTVLGFGPDPPVFTCHDKAI